MSFLCDCRGTGTASNQKKSRTVLVLGPPHSGKSTFSYLLFHSLRLLGHDAALVDADVMSPTLRCYDMMSEEEKDHVYPTMNRRKLTQEPPLKTYKRFVRTALDFVIEKGVIILDGLGKHTTLTDLLLQYGGSVVVVSRKEISDDELIEHGFHHDHAEHPFDFYKRLVDMVLTIESSMEPVPPFFKKETREALLHGLRREVVIHGDTSKIPNDSLKVIEEIGSFFVTLMTQSRTS
jgi:adenylate kinase family enzyme